MIYLCLDSADGIARIDADEYMEIAVMVLVRFMVNLKLDWWRG